MSIGNRGGGRKAKPTALKALSNPARALDPGTEPEMLAPEDSELAPPPLHLTLAQKKLWRDTLPLVPRGMLIGLDFRVYERWVVAADILDQLDKQLVKLEDWVVEVPATERTIVKPDGTTITTKTYARKVVSPYAQVYNDTFQRFMRANVDLGFPPTSRARIGIWATRFNRKEKGGNRFAKHAPAA